MKLKSFILSFFLLSLVAIAQEKNSILPKDYTVTMDSLLLHVNKDQINTGLLYDRVVNNANLLDFNNKEKPQKSSMWHFIQAISEVHRSRINSKYKLPQEIIDEQLRNKDNIIDIGYINTPLNYIDYGTKEKPNLSFKEGYFYNIDSINPFKEKRITVVAALKEVIHSREVKIRLSPYFFYQDDLNPIKNLTATIAGSKIKLIDNFKRLENETALKLEGSENVILFDVEFDNAIMLQTSATISISLPQTSPLGPCDLAEDFVGNTGIDHNSPENTIPFQGYNETTPIKGVLEYRTYYNKVTNQCGNPLKIRKPIIILDGFDPGDKRKIYDGSDGYDSSYQSLYELMTFDPDNNSTTDNNKNFIRDILQPQGFDVTLVNFPENKIIDPANPTQQVWVQTGVITHQIHMPWPFQSSTITWYEAVGHYTTMPRYKHLSDGGADYIERNAMAVVALLQRENSKLAANGSSEQITLVGPSMGGLISRYALAYMEKNNIPHNVKLWVSFDSPHLGANIPISGQENIYFFGYYGQKDQAKQKFHENFASPAARQMLIEQLDYKQQEYNWQDNPNLWFGGNGQNNNTPFRTHFINNLTSNGLPNSNGFPTNVRKIALINGTTNGTKTNSEGQLCLELAGFKPSWFKAVAIEDRNLSSINGISQTFSGKVSIPTVLVQIFGTQIPGFPIVITSTVNRSNPNPRGCMDVVPGGTYKTFDIIKNEFQPELDAAGVSSDWRTNLNKHAFIPSVSSLAFKNSNFEWSTPLNRNLICDSANKEIPFDTYFSPSTNENHVFVTNESQAWLLNEFNGIHQAPNFSIAPDAFLSSNTSVLICDGQTNTYTISDVCKVPSPVTNWSVQGNLQIVPGSIHDYSVTVQATSNYSSTGKIIATFQNGETFEKIVNIGSPSLSTVDTTIGNIFGWYCAGFANIASPSVTTVPTATSYRWQIDYDDDLGLPIHCTNSTNPSLAKFTTMDTFGNNNHVTSTTPAVFQSVSPTANINWGNCTGNYLLSCYAVNDCGETPYLMKYVTVGTAATNPCASSTGLSRFAINPNPVSDGTITVNFNHNQLPCDPPSTYSGKMASTVKEVKIFDMNGTEKFSGSYNDEETFSIKGINLISGNYILSIKFPDGQIDKEIIVIQ